MDVKKSFYINCLEFIGVAGLMQYAMCSCRRVAFCKVRFGALGGNDKAAGDG
jgi:hypothetical protein